MWYRLIEPDNKETVIFYVLFLPNIHTNTHPPDSGGHFSMKIEFEQKEKDFMLKHLEIHNVLPLSISFFFSICFCINCSLFSVLLKYNQHITVQIENIQHLSIYLSIYLI